MVTVLLEDAAVLKEVGLLPHLLLRLAADVLPFELVAADSSPAAAHGPGADDAMLTKLQMLLARTPAGSQGTIVNNNGVTKQPAAAAVVDHGQRLSAIVRIKPGYGT